MIGPIMYVTFCVVVRVRMHVACQLIVEMQGTAQHNGRHRHGASCRLHPRDRNQGHLEHKCPHRQEHGRSGELTKTLDHTVLHGKRLDDPACDFKATFRAEASHERCCRQASPLGSTTCRRPTSDSPRPTLDGQSGSLKRRQVRPSYRWARRRSNHSRTIGKHAHSCGGAAPSSHAPARPGSPDGTLLTKYNLDCASEANLPQSKRAIYNGGDPGRLSEEHCNDPTPNGMKSCVDLCARRADGAIDPLPRRARGISRNAQPA